MGSSSWSSASFAKYCDTKGVSYDTHTKRFSGQTYTATKIDKDLKPYKIIRECVNSEEHPNTIPIILALDVTGSMGAACKETAETLGKIMSDLYSKYKDIEILVMGIGDLAYDYAPIQMSQYESDTRIAEWLDKIWMEHGGGGNSYESYTAAWYMGLHHTKLDAYDKQGRKGIIITMGDEPLNPYLPMSQLKNITGDPLQDDVKTKELYDEASRKFDIYHIAVDDIHDAYRHYKEAIHKSYSEVLKNNFKVSSINALSSTICECIDDSIQKNPVSVEAVINEPFVVSVNTTNNINEESNNFSSEGISW